MNCKFKFILLFLLQLSFKSLNFLIESLNNFILLSYNFKFIKIILVSYRFKRVVIIVLNWLSNASLPHDCKVHCQIHSPYSDDCLLCSLGIQHQRFEAGSLYPPHHYFLSKSAIHSGKTAFIFEVFPPSGVSWIFIVE